MLLHELLTASLLLLPLGSVVAQSPHTQAVPDRAEDVCPLKPGMDVPDIRLAAVEGGMVSLPEACAEQPTVLIFYRGGWCPFCNVQLGQLQSREQDLRDLGYRIIGISPDTPQHLKESIGKHELTYSLLSDSDMEAAKQFGVAYQLDKETVDKYKGYNLDIEGASGQTHHMLPVPAVFVLDRSGRIVFSYVNPDYKVRLDPDVLIAAAKAAVNS
ncbi:MAG: AhpC/TSA family protein [Bacteroidetes bacterium]|nr:AhpC/TSA family protein [Bacteroidota bacterium]